MNCHLFSQNIFMIPKIAFILGAGLGTRMGSVGERIPKPLWPVGSLTLLEIVLNQIKCWGIEEVYLNCHHQHQIVQEFVKKKKLSLKLIFEPNLLGSGGCFAHLKSLIGPSRILACNADSLMFIEKSFLKAQCEQHQKGHLLFARKVSPLSGYNALVVNDKHQLRKIQPPPFEEDYWTFSGISLVDLSLVDAPVEPSSFFESVVIPGAPDSFVSLADTDFYDFGTLENYANQLIEICEGNRLEDHLERLGISTFYEKQRNGLRAESFEMSYCKNSMRIEFTILSEKAKIELSLPIDFGVA